MAIQYEVSKKHKQRGTILVGILSGIKYCFKQFISFVTTSKLGLRCRCRANAYEREIKRISQLHFLTGSNMFQTSLDVNINNVIWQLELLKDGQWSRARFKSLFWPHWSVCFWGCCKDLDELTETVTSYISFCEDMCILPGLI